jgi:hypothetical protein
VERQKSNVRSIAVMPLLLENSCDSYDANDKGDDLLALGITDSKSRISLTQTSNHRGANQILFEAI